MPELNTDALKALHKKRRALDRLVAFTQQISRLGKTFEMTCEIAKPSQKPNPKLFPILNQLMEHIKHLQSAKLVVSLDQIDKDIRRELTEILALAEIDEAEFFERLSRYKSQDLKTAHDVLMQEIQDFKRKTQTDVAIRYELNQRGVAIRSGLLPIDQEKLASQAHALKTQESQCKRKIMHNIESLLQDTQSILDNEDYPSELKQKVAYVKIELENNLHTLKHEQDVENIPVFVASYDLYDTPDGLQDSDFAAEAQAAQEAEAENNAQPADSDAELAEPTTANASSNVFQKPQIFKTLSQLTWVKLAAQWLTTPWQVSWQSLKNQQAAPATSRKTANKSSRAG